MKDLVTGDQAGEFPAVADLFAELGRSLAAHPTVAATLQAVTDAAVARVPGARWASVSRGVERGLVSLAVTGEMAAAADTVQYAVGSGPGVDAVGHDAVVVGHDLSQDTRWRAWSPRAVELGVRSVVSVRMTDQDDDPALNAALTVYGDHADAFDATSTTIAVLLATHGALAVAATVHRQSAENLLRALDSNREIGTAMGVLMATRKVTREQAFDLLRIASQSGNRKMRAVAADVVDTGHLELPLPRADRVRARRPRSVPRPPTAG